MPQIFFAFSQNARNFNEAMKKLDTIISNIDNLRKKLEQELGEAKAKHAENETLETYYNKISTLYYYHGMLCDTRQLIITQKPHSLFSVNDLSTMVAPLNSGEIDNFIKRAKDFKDTNRNLYLSFLSLIVALTIGALVLSGLMLGGVVPATAAAFLSFLFIGVLTSTPSIAWLIMAIGNTESVENMKNTINTNLNAEKTYKISFSHNDPDDNESTQSYEKKINYHADDLMTFFSQSNNGEESLKDTVLNMSK